MQARDRVGIRELRNDVASVVRRAGGGEHIVVTVDGHPVAEIGPLSPMRDQPTLDDLIVAGLVRPPTRERGPTPDPDPLPVDVRLDDLLIALRGS